jgi:hypothetical protein
MVQFLDKIYIIKKMFLNGRGYDIIGFYLNEKDAKDYCNNGKIFTHEDNPGIWEGCPIHEFEYEVIKHLV